MSMTRRRTAVRQMLSSVSLPWGGACSQEAYVVDTNYTADNDAA
jgi:hypothetical protein